MKLGPVYQDGDDYWQDVLGVGDGDLKPDGTEFFGDTSNEWLGCVFSNRPFSDSHKYRIPAIPPTTTSEPTIPLSVVVDLLMENVVEIGKFHQYLRINNAVIIGETEEGLKSTITKELTRLYLGGK